MNWDHHPRTLLLNCWLIGFLISTFAVGCTFFAHTPAALIGLVLSLPMLPVIFILAPAALQTSLGHTTMSIVLPASLVFIGSLIYGGIALLVNRTYRRRHRNLG